MKSRQGVLQQVNEESNGQNKITDVMIGAVSKVDDSGNAYVHYTLCPSPGSVPAQSTILISPVDVGREVVLVFLEGCPTKPLVIGFLHQPQPKEVHLLKQILSREKQPLDIQVDGETLTFSANREIVIRCGESSITMTRAGKILIRGRYILSRSSGVNKIKGGSVQIN
jgi:hypothetical protein